MPYLDDPIYHPGSLSIFQHYYKKLLKTEKKNYLKEKTLWLANR
jgi:hypothetical protein